MYNSGFYKNLKKPSFMPQGVVFTWAWIILYTLMGLSLYLVIVSDSPLKWSAIGIFGLQLLLNLLWSPLFFYFKKIKSALYLSIFLTLTVLLMIVIFFQISKIAAILQIPYFLWLIFANILNLIVVEMNPHIEN